MEAKHTPVIADSTSNSNPPQTGDQTDSSITKLLERWLMGSDAPARLADFPTPWHDLLQQMPDNQQSLTAFALMGHYQALTDNPHTQDGLQPFPALPTLSKPLINTHNPSAYHMLVRLLEQSNQSQDKLMIMTLLADRGYSLPPSSYFAHIAHQNLHQYLNTNTANVVMADYQPWQLYWNTWQHRLTKTDVYEDLDINAENWDDFMPAFRRHALEHLRRQDPTACRELIIECFAQESAEERAKILSVLYTKLTTEDVPFLQSLLNDRSKKVIEMANHLLIRAGYFSTKYISGNDQNDDNQNDDNQNDDNDNKNNETSLSEEDKVDLALLIAGFEVNKKQQVMTTRYRENKKRTQRRELLIKYGLPCLALGLEIDLHTLLLGWVFNKHHTNDNEVFLACASHLPDEYMPDIIQGLSEYTFEYVHHILPIWHRFSKAQQQQLLIDFMSNAQLELRFADLLTFAVVLPAHLEFKWLTSTPMWKKLLGIGVDKKKYEQYSYLTEDDCIALGLLLPQELAKEVLTFLQETLQAYTSNDTMYYALRLNVDLNQSDVT